MKHKLLVISLALLLMSLNAYSQQWSGSSNTSETISRLGVTNINATGTNPAWTDLNVQDFSVGPSTGQKVVIHAANNPNRGSVFAYDYGISSGIDLVLGGNINFTAAYGNILIPGKVGLGTSSPESPLHIKSTINRTIRLDFTGINPNNTYTWQSLQTNSTEQWRLVGRDSDNANLEVWNKNSDNILTLLQDGKIGIGTSDPDAKLTVKGDIHTQEVTVDLNGAVTPDFVFEEDYDLKSLEETEEYIQANKHLPEIPSASEMEENGFELKEMNLKLLQKVEELTLYLIEQNKES